MKINNTFFIIFSALISILIVPDRIEMKPHIKIDFSSFYYAGQALSDNEDIYDRNELQSRSSDDMHIYPYIYPPTLALAIQPLAKLDIYSAQFYWTIIDIISFAIGLSLLLIIARKHLPSQPGVNNLPFLLIFAAFVAAALPYRYIIFMGQVDPIVLLFVCLALYYHFEDKDFVAGAFLGAAAMIKITPAILLFYLLARKRYKSLYGFAIAGAAIFLISLIFIDFSYWINFARFFTTNAASQDVEGLGNVSNLYNYSLLGFFTRLTNGSAWAKILTYITGGGALAAAIIYAKKYANGKEALPALLPFLILMITLTPMSWRQHMIYILPGVFFLLAYLSGYAFIRKYFILNIIVLFACGVAGLDLYAKYSLFAQNNYALPLLTSINLYALTALFIISLRVIKRDRRIQLQRIN